MLIFSFPYQKKKGNHLILNSSVIKPGSDRWVDLVNQHLSWSEFLIKPVMLLTRKNLLKPSGFCANRVTRLSYYNPAGFAIFMNITLLGHFSIFILFKIGLFGNNQ
jgi:hypothetical protein